MRYNKQAFLSVSESKVIAELKKKMKLKQQFA